MLSGVTFGVGCQLYAKHSLAAKLQGDEYVQQILAIARSQVQSQAQGQSQFHRLTTQWPWQVWLAIENKAHRPKIDFPPVQLVYMSGEAFTSGIEEHLIEGVTVRVFNVAKTVVDCFKYRKKVGQDVAIEALRDYLNEQRGPRSELYHYGRICRVDNVMPPYLDALSFS